MKILPPQFYGSGDLMQACDPHRSGANTPFLERARDLYEQSGESTILVAGSSGAFFYIADYVTDGPLLSGGYHGKSEGNLWTVSGSKNPCAALSDPGI